MEEEEIIECEFCGTENAKTAHKCDLCRAPIWKQRLRSESKPSGRMLASAVLWTLVLVCGPAVAYVIVTQPGNPFTAFLIYAGVWVAGMTADWVFEPTSSKNDDILFGYEPLDWGGPGYGTMGTSLIFSLRFIFFPFHVVRRSWNIFWKALPDD